MPVLSTSCGLTQPFILRDGQEHGVLTGREIVQAHLCLEDIGRALARPMQLVNGRAIELSGRRLT